MAPATTFSAASQLDMGRLFPCCWPVSFCRWVIHSSQFKWKYTLWKDWFYQKLILNILHSCAVQCTLQVLLYCWWYRWPQLPRRSQAGHQGRGGRAGYCPRMLSINKLLPPVSNWGVQGRDAEEAPNCHLLCRISGFKGGTPAYNIQKFMSTDADQNFIIYFRATRSQVKDTLLDCPLSPPGTRPIICVDEWQVWNRLNKQKVQALSEKRIFRC